MREERQSATDKCIAHGGGRRCNYPKCKHGAEGKTLFCVAHGGGRRCTYPTCTKSAQGATDKCDRHANGGGDEACVHPHQNSLLTTGQRTVLHDAETLEQVCMAKSMAMSVPAQRMRSSSSISSSISSSSSSAAPPPSPPNIDQLLATSLEEAAKCTSMLIDNQLHRQDGWMETAMSYFGVDKAARLFRNLKYR